MTLKSSLDVLRGSFLHARDSVVPRDVYLEGRTGFGHSSIFSSTSLVLTTLACTSLKMDECPKPVRPSRKTSRGTTESLIQLTRKSKNKENAKGMYCRGNENEVMLK
ncbi:hypothetical protein O3M35_005032 [Rhynocoris fuscipes]|uniref:Uncharacterized protein n=1 Tax=Rhynocoris fuscipes TaxID=488301 RepID=A0AAW1DPB7_9HEMI